MLYQVSMHMALRIGLTGPIASGKTTVSDYWHTLGIMVIDTDLIAKELLKNTSPAYQEVLHAFGSQICHKDGSINRHALKKIIFDDRDAKKQLEAILHPKIRQRLMTLSKAHSDQDQLIVIPLLYHKQDYPWLNYIVSVETAPQQQLARLLERDGIDVSLAQKMIADQAQQRPKSKLADFTLNNGQSQEDLYRQIDQLHQQLCCSK